MPDFAVTTAFKAKDGVTSAFARMEKGSRRFGNQANKDFDRAARGARKFQSITGGILKAGVITRGLGLLQRGTGAVVDEFLEFDRAITVAAAKFPQRIKRGTDAFEELKKAARDVGATTEFTAAQAAAGLEEYAKAGIDASTSMALLQSTAELATNANVEFAQAADFALTALDAFNLRSKDAATTAANLKRVNDTLTAVVNSAKLEIEDFNETLKFTGPVAAQVGASIEDVATMTGLVAKAGIKGSLAGTALKNTYLGLAASTPKAKKVLKDLNVETTDSSGNLRDALDILVDFSKATEDMGNAQRLASIEAVFGRRSIAAVSKIMSLGSDEIERYRDSINDSKDASALMAEEIRKSLTNRLEVLKSTAIELGFKFLEAFEVDGKKGIEALIEAIREFDIKPVVQEVKEFATMAMDFFKFLWDNRKVVKAIVKGFIALKLILAGINIAKAIREFGAFGKSLWQVAKAQIAFKKASTGVPGAPTAAAAPTAPAAPGKVQPPGTVGPGAIPGAAIPAAIIGYQLGDMLEQNWLDPIRQAGIKFETTLGNMATRYEGVGRNAFKVGDASIAELQLARKQIQMLLQQAKAEGPPVHSIEEFFMGVSEMGASIATRFNEMIGIMSPEEAAATMKEHESILTERQRNEQKLIDAYGDITAQLIKLKQQLIQQQASGSLNINVQAPPGSQVTTQSSGSAPKVNTAKGGKNP